MPKGTSTLETLASGKYYCPANKCGCAHHPGDKYLNQSLWGQRSKGVMKAFKGSLISPLFHLKCSWSISTLFLLSRSFHSFRVWSLIFTVNVMRFRTTKVNNHTRKWSATLVWLWGHLQRGLTEGESPALNSSVDPEGIDRAEERV